MPDTKDQDRVGGLNESELHELRERLHWARRTLAHRGTAVAVRVGDMPLAFGYFKLDEQPPLRAVDGKIISLGLREWRLLVAGPRETYWQLWQTQVHVRFGDLDRQEFEGHAYVSSCDREALLATETWTRLIGVGALTRYLDTPGQ